MDVEEAIDFLDELALAQEIQINDIYRNIVRVIWSGLTYGEIYKAYSFTVEYATFERDTTQKFFKLMRSLLQRPVKKDNLRGGVEAEYRRQQALQNSEQNEVDPQSTSQNPADDNSTTVSRDWGEAPDITVFHGCTQELDKLEQWIVPERCRLVALLGLEGIGKTALAAKFLEQIHNQFEYVIWRSLLHTPPLEQILAELIQFLPNESQTDLPERIDSRISRLIDCLRSHRCLLVLDNLDGNQSYRELLRRVAEAQHQSCLIVTSREQTIEIASLEGRTRAAVRSLTLEGLGEEAAREILRDYELSAEQSWGRLIHIYSGNPLMLRIVSAHIGSMFDGNVAEFLRHGGTWITRGINELLESQFNNLSDLENQVMYHLANEQEPVRLQQLQGTSLSASPPNLLQALESLKWRSLIESSTAGFTLQPVIMEYVKERMGESDGEQD